MVTSPSTLTVPDAAADPLLESQLAFDAVATRYDGPSGNNALIQRWRERLRNAVLDQLLQTPYRSLLDLGCGPGQDAEFFGRRGHRITAIDWAPGMVSQARRRITDAGLCERVEIRHLGIHELDRLSGEQFDGVYSNLGPLNCVPHLADVGRAIFERVRPGGWLIASIIGRVCPWELALYALKGDGRRARLRFVRTGVPVPLEHHVVWTRYYRPSEFTDLFEAAGFTHLWHRGLGVVMPPPYMAAFAERHPRLLNALQVVEDCIAGWPGIRECGDHFLVAMRKP